MIITIVVAIAMKMKEKQMREKEIIEATQINLMIFMIILVLL